jgi:hypothetical protein
MDGVTLADLRARREAMDEEVRKAEVALRMDWNGALYNCEDALNEWLCERSVEVASRERKNATIWDVGHGALEVTFVRDDEQYGAGALRMTSGKTLTLEWSEVPEPARMLAIVAALLNVKDEAASTEG